MNTRNIRKYAGLMKELDLSALEITEGDTKVRLERNVSANFASNIAAAPMTVPVMQAPVMQAAPANTNTAVPASAPVSGGHPITSPMVGVFYCAPAENAEPFVKVGQTVKKGDTVGIIEAMKLMNEVVSDVDGVVEEICVENAETVDYGRVLMRIK